MLEGLRQKAHSLWLVMQHRAQVISGHSADVLGRFTPAQRMLAGSVAAIAMVTLVASISLSTHTKPKSIVVQTPSIEKKVVLSAPPRPIAAPAAPEPSAPTEATQSIPLAEQLRTLQNNPVTLAAAPLDELLVATAQGNLPKIAADGRAPWQVYARPVAAIPAGTPQLAVLLIDMGLSERLTLPALEQLPGQVSIALNAHSPKLPDYVAAARKNSHEVVLDVPAEPRFYPEEDPGPDALMTRISANENTSRLRTWLAKSPGVIGITTSTGSQFVADASAATPVMNELKLRGLAWVDSGISNSQSADLATRLGLVTASAHVDLDKILTPSAIRTQFSKALDLARANGSAILLARPYPLTVSLLQELLGTLPDAGIALVPVSALTRQPQSAAGLSPTPVAPVAHPAEAVDEPAADNHHQADEHAAH